MSRLFLPKAVVAADKNTLHIMPMQNTVVILADELGLNQEKHYNHSSPFLPLSVEIWKI